MPRLEPHLCLLLLGLGSACSLHSLQRLDRCRGEPVSSECPDDAAVAGTPGIAGNQSEGGSTAGSNAAGSTSEGGGASMPAAGADAGGEPSTGGAGGARPDLPELAVLYDDRSEMYEPDMAKAIVAAFVIRNDSNDVIDVARLTLRYYYTLEAPTEQHFSCDFVDKDEVVGDCKGLSVSFGELNGEAANYAEVSFTPPEPPWELSPRGGKSGVFQLRFYNGENFLIQDQENDYSFRTSNDDTPSEWDHVTLYVDGQRVWGIEPQ